MTKYFVAIAGNIGVGKSTLTTLMTQKLGWDPFFEAVEENPYLADFYKDMSRWSFHSQAFFLSRRLQQHYGFCNAPIQCYKIEVCMRTPKFSRATCIGRGT